VPQRQHLTLTVKPLRIVDQAVCVLRVHVEGRG
jgi:hypothetical protein